MKSPNRPLKLEDIKKPELAEGENPFVEEEIVDAKEADAGAPVDYRGAYETVDNKNAWIVLVFALVGFVLSVLPLAGYLLAITGGTILPGGVLLGVFGWLVSWIIALPALVYAQNDLKGVRLRQYSPRGVWMSHTAFWISLVTIVNSLVVTVVFLWEAFSD